MKTKAFRSFRLNEVGKKQLKTLAELPSETVSEIVSFFASADSIPTYTLPLAENIANKTSSTTPHILDALSITNTLLSHYEDGGDSISDFMDDLRSLSLLNKDEDYKSIQQFLEAVIPYVKKIHRFSKIRETESAAANELRAITTSIAIKPIFDKEFEYGKDKITEFDSNILDYTNVVQMEFHFTGEPDSIVFQANEEILDILISQLLAAQLNIKKTKLAIEAMKNH